MPSLCWNNGACGYNSRTWFKNLFAMMPMLMWNIYYMFHINMGIIANKFLNQVRAGCRPACVWFLKIVSVRTSVCVCVCQCVCVFVCVCPPLRLLITNGTMWHDMDTYDWLNKFYSCYMATEVIIVNVCDHGIGTHRRH